MNVALFDFHICEYKGVLGLLSAGNSKNVCKLSGNHKLGSGPNSIVNGFTSSLYLNMVISLPLSFGDDNGSSCTCTIAPLWVASIAIY